MGAQNTCCRAFFRDKEFKDKYVISSKKAIKNLIRLQAIYRGYIYRKKSKHGSSTNFTSKNGSQGDIFQAHKRPGMEVAMSTEPPELSSKIKRLKDMLHTFELNEK